MTPPPLPHDERLLDLLALRAVEGLDDADEALVAALEDAGVLDEAAAVLAIRFSVREGLEPMPESLRRGLERLGADLVAGRDHGRSPVAGMDRTGGTAGWIGALGWLAAAACLALAVIGWSLPRTRTPGIAPPEERLADLESRPGVVRTAWVGLDAAGLSDAAHRFDRDLSGEVVWDPQTNEGYMVFDGLAANDPAVFQYQLWIFDENRPTGQLPQFGEGILSQRPVDGGVFDVLDDGRVVVPVRAKLPVGKAVIFAVTVEPPGGVVVSDRDIVTLALVSN